MADSSNISRRIHRLPPLLIDRIAAGEVVDGPHSVVKELMENSLDAGATSLRVTTEGGGLVRIVVEDDGEGIAFQDLPLSVERHATSKIDTLEDIERIGSFGFRGEALASIASVSHLTICTKNRNESIGGFLESRGGEVERCEPFASPGGTVITVTELFYATPARKKFVKSEKGENARIYREILKIAIAHPSIRIEYFRDGREFLVLPSSEGLPGRLSAIYGMNMEERLLEVDREKEGTRIHGYVSFPDFYRGNRDGQFLFVNGRCVEIRNFPSLVRKAYGELAPPGGHPYYFLFLELDPLRVDVNVHPAKKEVRLQDESLLQGLVFRAVEDALRQNEPIDFRRIAPSLGGASFALKRGDFIGGERRDSGSERLLPLEHAPSVPSASYEITRSMSPLPLYDSYRYGLREESIAGEDTRAYGGRGDEIGGAGAGPSSSRDRQSSLDYSPEAMPPGGGESPSIDAKNREGNLRFIPRRHFGVIFGTYILAEGEDGLYIIDQHTAHERINYERIRNNFEGQKGSRQTLMHPPILRLDAGEMERILDHRERLEENGFVVEEYGKGACVLREVPSYLDATMDEDTALHMIHRVLEGEEGFRLYDEFAALKACKASVKRNDHVSGEVISSLLRDLSLCEEPGRCPHGRPTMIRITKKDLDAMFHRI